MWQFNKTIHQKRTVWTYPNKKQMKTWSYFQFRKLLCVLCSGLLIKEERWKLGDTGLPRWRERERTSLPAQTRAPSLRGEAPLGGGLATHSSVLAGHSRRQRGLVGHSPWGHKESDTTEATCRAHHWMDGGVLYWDGESFEKCAWKIKDPIFDIFISNIRCLTGGGISV